jgi:terminase large subunit-like protein
MPETSSPIDSLRALPESDRRDFIDSLTDEEAAALLFDWNLWARPTQLEPDGDWRIWLLLSGRGFGKTRAGAEWVRAKVQEHEFVNLVGPTAADVRDVMVTGESGILSVCPPAERPVYHPSTRSLAWPNGAYTLTFSAEDPEQLRGPQHAALWCDEMAAWSAHTRQETWDLAMFGLRLGWNPRALVTTTPKPVGLLRELINDPNVVITKGTSYENEPNLAPAFFDSLITKYEGTRLGRQELDAELLLDEGLAYQLKQGVHIIPAVEIADTWARFEAMDYGTNNPTSWGCFATDYDANVIAFGLYHQPGYPSETAPEIHRRRLAWWAKDDRGRPVRATCYAPPDIKTRWGKKDPRGNEMSAESEFADHGIMFATAQNDRRAGYIRVAEMLKLDEGRKFPDWHPLRGQTGAPRFYIVDTEEMQPLIEAIKDAPLEDPESPLSKLPLEAVDQAWESAYGHAHAMLRYGLMSRPSPSLEPEEIPDDPRARLLYEVEKKRDAPRSATDRYDW